MSKPITKAGRAHVEDLLTNDHPYRDVDRDYLEQTISSIEDEAQGRMVAIGGLGVLVGFIVGYAIAAIQLGYT